MQGSVATHVARAVGRFARAQPARISWPGGVVSFTFDDFPKSALAAGAAVLERHDVRGTYYAALGLAEGDAEMGPIAGCEEIRAAHARGHELACHTYSHLDCSQTSATAILADLDANAARFAALLDGFVPVSFAYPFGALSLSARRALACRFQSCRGIGGGINSGTADLANLASARVYHSEFDEPALHALIDRNAAIGGWLIFYTHDVAAAPSPYGCTPEELERAVAYAAKRCAVLPVREVVTRLRGG